MKLHAPAPRHTSTSSPRPSVGDAGGRGAVRPAGAGDPGKVDAPTDHLTSAWCARLRDGDEAALEALFRRLREPLLRRIARLLGGDVAGANDIVQESFVRLWTSRASLDPGRSVEGWLYRTGRNLALNRVRDSDTRRELLARHDAPGPARVERPDEALERREFAHHMEAWVEGLPDRQREAVRLTRFEGLDHREAADAMACSPRTVNNHLVRALRTLRERMDRYLREGQER